MDIKGKCFVSNEVQTYVIKSISIQNIRFHYALDMDIENNINRGYYFKRYPVKLNMWW